MNASPEAPAPLESEVPLATRDIAVSVGSRDLVAHLSAEFSRGEFVAILGRNGSGKTLTLHTLAGLRPPSRGTVLVDGLPLEHQRRRHIARRLGLLAQDLEEGFVATVLETVLIGRHPHLAFWEWESTEDERLAQEALAAVGLSELADRHTDTLSGGERRRVAIAALLAQRPGVLLLDEPTNHLDPHHQLDILRLFRQLVDAGHTVIATLHDPTLAVRFADRAILLFGNGRWTAGPVSRAVTQQSLSELYLTDILEVNKDGRRIFVTA